MRILCSLSTVVEYLVKFSGVVSVTDVIQTAFFQLQSNDFQLTFDGTTISDQQKIKFMDVPIGGKYYTAQYLFSLSPKSYGNSNWHLEFICRLVENVPEAVFKSCSS